jgi:hypothetical protein
LTLRLEGKPPFRIPLPGIFSTIDSFGKRMIHAYFEDHGVLPPWFPDVGAVRGFLSGSELHWSRFFYQDENTNLRLTGMPDDVFHLADGSYHVIDYKTARLTKAQRGLYPLYEVQLNVYALIAEENGYSPVSAISLVYTEPRTQELPDDVRTLMSDADFHMPFNAIRKDVRLHDRPFVLNLLQEARRIDDEVHPPQGADGCENCTQVEQLIAFALGGPEGL